MSLETLDFMRNKFRLGNYRKYVLLLIVFLINGCAYVSVEKIFDDDLPKKEKNADILLLEGDLNRNYKPIAFVTLIGSLVTKKKQIEKKMKNEARKIGGDAVIFVTYSQGEGHYLNATAIVVVYE